MPRPRFFGLPAHAADDDRRPARAGTCRGAQPSLHQRRSLAWTIELVFDPRAAARRGFARTPRIPIGNRAAVQEPLRQIMLILRDPQLAIDTPLDDLGLFAADPNSPLFEPYPNRARYAAHAAFENLAAGARRAEAHTPRADAATPHAWLAEGYEPAGTRSCSRSAGTLMVARRVGLKVAVAVTLSTLLAAACSGTSTAPSTEVSSTPAAATPAHASTLRSLIAHGARIKLFASGLGYAEGPLWLPDGRLIASDVVNDVVFVFDAAGHKSVFRRPSNIANGHALDANGSVVEAEAGDKTHHPLVARIAADGSATMLADNYRGKHLNEPNDLIVKRDGTIWFTDPSFDADPSALGFYGVYRLDAKTKVVTLLSKALGAPNGIAFSPDEKTLYVSDTGSGKVVSFPIIANKTLGRPNLQFGEGCDGIAVDERGDIWATTCALDVVITAPSGKRIGAIPFPGATSNLAWGGSNGKTLFVTTEEGDVYSLALTVRETR